MSHARNARNDPTATSASSRLKFLFSCCFTASYDRGLDALPFITDEYDFIVEKLLVKRVPLGLFAIPRDINEGRKDDVFLGDQQPAAVLSSNQRKLHSGTVASQGLSGNTKAVTYASPTNTNQNTSRDSKNSGTPKETDVCGSHPKFVECTSAKTRDEELLENLLTLNSESSMFSKSIKNPNFFTAPSCFQEIQKDATPKSKFVVAPVRVEYDAINEQSRRHTSDNNKRAKFEKLYKHARQDGSSYLQEIRENAGHSVKRKFLIAPRKNMQEAKLSNARDCNISNDYADPNINLLENLESKTLDPILKWKITARHCAP